MKYELRFDPFESLNRTLKEIGLNNARSLRIAFESIQKSNSEAIREAMRFASGTQLSATHSINDVLERFRSELSKSFQEITANLQSIQQLKIQVPNVVIPKLEFLIDRTIDLIPDNEHSQIPEELNVSRTGEATNKITWQKVYDLIVIALMVYSSVVFPIQSSIQNQRHHQERMEIESERLEIEREQLSVSKEQLEIEKQNLMLNQEITNKQESFEQAFNSFVHSISSLMQDSVDPE